MSEPFPDLGAGSRHSEELLAVEIDDFRKSGHTVTIEELFTEREPCTVATCRKQIETIMQNPKVYYWTNDRLKATTKGAHLAFDYGL